MSGLVFELAELAAPGTLAGDLIAGKGPVPLPTVGETDPRPRPGKLDASSFGTTSSELKAKLERVLAGEGFVVSTGQQPVLFLGPMYVVYKALSAIELAAALEEALEVPVVPVFWIASDDHDWDEIGQTTIAGADGTLTTLRFDPPAGKEGLPVGPTPLGEEIHEILSELSQLVPPSEFTPAYLALLERSYAPGTAVGHAFAATLASVLAGREFAWLDSAESGVRAASASFFDTILSDVDGVLAAMSEGADLIETGGHSPAIAHVEGGLPLFYEKDVRARVVQGEDNAIFAGRDSESHDLDTWKTRLAEEPERFSPNVSSRPALESYLMPVAATVLGPGEIAYWSQLVPLFEKLDVPLPAIVPRAAFCVVEPRIRKTLDKLSAAFDEFSDGGDAVAARITAESRPADVDAAIAALRTAIGEQATALEAAVASELPGLNAAAGKTGKALHDAVGQFDRQVNSMVRERQDTALGQAARAANILWPNRRPQERLLSPFYFLCRYGPSVIEQAREEVSDRMSSCLARAPGAR